MPDTISQPLDIIGDALRQSLGANLVSLILYGSAARGSSQPGISDVNLLIVLDNIDLAAIASIRTHICGQGQIRLSPYLLTRNELPRVAGAFPTRLLEMKRGYRVLHGEDVLASIELDQQVLSLRARQELLNILLRFRHQMLGNIEDDAIERDLEGFLQPLIKTLRTLVFLRSGNHLDSRKDVIEAAGRFFRIDTEPLLQLSAWRSGKVSFSGPEWQQAASAFFQALQQLSRELDG